MLTPMTRGQKLLAYASLVFVALWTLFGLFAIWLMLTE